MQDHGNQKNRPHRPQQRRIAVQRFGVVIHDGRAQKNLEIPEHMRDQETKQHQTGYCHDRLLAYG